MPPKAPESCPTQKELDDQNLTLDQWKNLTVNAKRALKGKLERAELKLLREKIQQYEAKVEDESIRIGDKSGNEIGNLTIPSEIIEKIEDNTNKIDELGDNMSELGSDMSDTIDLVKTLHKKIDKLDGKLDILLMKLSSNTCF